MEDLKIDNIKKKVAKMIKDYAKKNNHSYKEILSGLGFETNKAQLSKLMNCQGNPTLKTLKKVANYTGKRLQVNFK